MRPLSIPPSHEPQCELLFELFRGSHGRTCVGQMLKGTDAGRIVTLRQLSSAPERLAAAVDLARSLAHPQISKVLGIVHGDTNSHIASEYTPGASLFELGTALRKQQARLSAAASVRVVLDALKAATVAQQLLSRTANLGYTRILFSDTVWVAEYGEVLVTEIGLAPLLNQMHASSSEAEARTRDILTAGMEIFQLASGQLLTMDVSSKLAVLPKPLARLLEQVLRQPESFESPGDLARALEELPGSHRGTERHVADELRRVMRSTLETRRHTLNAIRQASTNAADEEMTQFSRASGIVASTTRDTARPPPDAPKVPQAPVTMSGARSSSAPSWHTDGDELTTVFKRGLPVARLPSPPVVPAPPVIALKVADWQQAPTRIDRADSVAPGAITGTPQSETPEPESNPFRRRGLSRGWIALVLVLLIAGAVGLLLLRGFTSCSPHTVECSARIPARGCES